MTHLGFEVWDTLGSGGRVGGVIVVLRTSPSWWGGLCKIWWKLVRQFAREKGT